MRHIRPLFVAVAILFCSLAASPARAQVVISVGIAPPELPVYEQPVCPGDGYIWTPGYWAWDGSDYYWVPGTWVEAPQVGFFWTPPYWGWGGAAFIFHEGYWGPHIGFYGGINYGFGYFGEGFVGGRWDGGHFYYNRAVNNINVTVIRNVYEERVNVREVTRVSYNGGRGGIEARPTREQESYDHERHVPPVAEQERHIEQARSNRELRASVNHGAPPVAATPRAGAYNDRNVVPAKGGAERNNTRSETTGHPNPPVHPKDLQPVERHPAQPTGNTKTDQKYQKQQQQLSARQDQERQRLQQKQEQEHQRATQQKATEAHNQQVEQKHQQQTQQLQQKHVQQQQHLEQKQQPPHQSAAPKEKH